MILDMDKNNYSITFMLYDKVYVFKGITFYYMCREELNKIVDAKIIYSAIGEIKHISRIINKES